MGRMLALLFLILSFAWPLSSGMAAPVRVTAADRHLVDQCEALFRTEWGEQGPGPQLRREERREAMQERLAEMALARMPRGELKRRLIADMSRLPKATLGYASVAYTLAYFGIAPVENMRRLNDVTALDATPFDVAATIAYRLDTIYRRHPTQAILAVYLTEREDGAFQEDLDSLRGQVFLSRPRTVLQIAAHDRAARQEISDMLLGECVTDDAPTMRRPILVTLRRFAHDKNVRIATVARECLRAISREQE